MSKLKSCNPTDVHIGNRLRSRRMQIKMSQTELGNIVGVTFQQIQKYEKGANRIGGSRMHQIAGVLGVSQAYFFEGLPTSGGRNANHDVPDLGIALMTTSEGAALARIWLDVPADIRRKLVDLAESCVIEHPRRKKAA